MAPSNTPTTYRIGLLHTKLNRLLKQRTTRMLEGTDIHPPEWALLGVLYEQKKGMRLRELAEELGVEASFITTMAKSLSKRGFVSLEADANDNRAKEITLSPAGKLFVDKTERQLRDSMRPLIGSVTMGNLLTYFSVLNALADAAEAIEKKETQTSND